MPMPNPNKAILQLIALCGWLVIIGLGFAALRPEPVLAHQGGFPLLYVAADGADRGECHDLAAPCRTIAYAINRAILGDEVRVAAGTYHLAEADIELLLSEVIPVRGGYRTESGYALQNPTKNPTYLIGPSPIYQAQLEARGFRLIRDAKAADLTAAVTKNTLIATANEPTTFTPCRNGQAGDHLCRGIDLLSRIPLASFSTQPAAANDIWGYVDLDDSREYAIIGLHNGTAVVEVTDPLNPVEVGTIPGPNTVWRDVKVYQFFNGSQSRWDAYAYVVADQVDQGLQIIDLSDLPGSISLAATYTATERAHNIALSDVDYATGVLNSGATAYAYLLGSEKGTGGFRILDLSNPTAPVETAAPPTAQYVHDATTVMITDSRTNDCFGHDPCELYIDFNIGTVDIWDVTDKSSPQMISSTPYAGSGYTHSGWWSQDKMHIFIHDEFDEQIFNHNSRVRTLDISDLT
ncbi:MAG: choice-of-anchor B family protein, partial [Anaerolineae bacterium]|nr:choice-of-anchor B family protein [Anaerolineae bacterium]